MERYSGFSKPEHLCGPEIYEPSTETSEANIHGQEIKELRETVLQLKTKIDLLEAENVELNQFAFYLHVNLEAEKTISFSRNLSLLKYMQHLKKDIEGLKHFHELNKKPPNQERSQIPSELVGCGCCAPASAHQVVKKKKSSPAGKTSIGNFRATRFENTQSIAIAFVIENSTSATLKLKDNYWVMQDTVEYEKIVTVIPPETTKAFGLTRKNYLNGLVSYQIHDKLFAIYCKCESQNIDANYIALALIPMDWAKMKSGKDLHWQMTVPHEEDYWNSPDVAFKKVITQNFKIVKELNAEIQLGNLQASAKVITGHKSIWTIKISEI